MSQHQIKILTGIKQAMLVCLLLPWDHDLVMATSCSELCHYVPWARDADCSRRHLESVPLECMGSKVLNLNKNNITTVHNGTFSGFNHLKYLQILENRIQMVFANAFAGARKLKSVNMAQNFLTVLPAHTFNDTSSLRWVYLSQNRITLVQEGVFQDSPNIEILYLDNNLLGQINEDAFRGLTKMQRLYLGVNGIQTLPRGIFRDLVELNFLDLSRNNLQMLNADIFSGLGKLDTIRLSGNRLVNIMPGIFSDNPITTLDISGNDLSTLHWDEIDFEGIGEIDATDNPWNCDCYLEPFRVAMVRLSKGVDSTAICFAPLAIAHTDLVSHVTLCPDPTKSSPIVKKPLVNIYGRRQDPEATAEVIPSENSTSLEMIALILAICITIVGLLGLLFIRCNMRSKQKNPDKISGSPDKVMIEPYDKTASNV